MDNLAVDVRPLGLGPPLQLLDIRCSGNKSCYTAQYKREFVHINKFLLKYPSCDSGEHKS